MNLKEAMFNKIEKNSIKINTGEEEIYLKKSGLIKDWRVIYPPIDLISVEKNTNEDGVINWDKVEWNKINLIFGGYRNALNTLLITGIILLIIIGAYDLVNSYNSIINNPIIQSCVKSAGIVLG